MKIKAGQVWEATSGYIVHIEVNTSTKTDEEWPLKAVFDDDSYELVKESGEVESGLGSKLFCKLISQPEQTYTLEQLRKTFNNLGWSEASWDCFNAQLNADLVRENDPQYQEYLRLKGIYE